MNKKFNAVKDHVYRHRATYAVAATLVVVGIFEFGRGKQWNAFLDSKGLTDEFYSEAEEVTV